MSEVKLGVVDYGRGNLRSVVNAYLSLGYAPRIVQKASELEGLSHIVVPGQGAFGDCMTSLNRADLGGALKDWIEADRPFFGICVGYQILFDGSEESPEIAGLGVIRGQVRHFADHGLKVPHMGWNAARITQEDHPYWQGLDLDPYFYFIHSYFPDPQEEGVEACRTEYGESFAAAITKGNLLATQFHPEKSQHAGLTLLKNFVEATPH